MRLPSFARRTRPTFEQLDLFGGVAPAEPPHKGNLLALVRADESVPTQPIDAQKKHEAESHEQTVIPDFESFVVDLPDVAVSRDFRITEAHLIGVGSITEKARDNVAAIRALKAIEAEARIATDDERCTLARYVGWGAMSNVFGYYPPDHLRATAETIRDLLTPVEFDAARASTPNAHYTSPMVIRAIWDALRHMGVSGPVQILEPAMGVGHFFGLMPDELGGSQRTGVELDSITARIAKQLYPDASIFAQGFEETPLPNNYFDVAVGNVPFGDYAVHDPSMKRQLTRAIHDYFFAKSLDKVRPGGIMALITSRYTMDKEDSTVRTFLSERADLLGAVRLPNTAFKANAGTEVTTDILFLRKLEAGMVPAGHDWLEIEPVTISTGQQVRINEYFAAHPQMMLGALSLEGTMYRAAEPTLSGELNDRMLTSAIEQLPCQVYVPRDRQRPPPATMRDPSALAGAKDGAYVEHDSAIYIRNGEALEPAALSASAVIRVRGQMAIRDALREVFATQLDDRSEGEITAARVELNYRYDSYISKHGPLSSRDNVRAFSGDPDQPLLLSLETYDSETKLATKAAAFHRRTLQKPKPVEGVETAAEALAISLNETGSVDWPTMERLTGRSAKRMQRELDGMIFRNPETGWETADQYLSGDVRAKLKTAQSASVLDQTYARNVEALTAVQPEDLLPGDISARLGSPWIPSRDVRDFLIAILDVSGDSLSVTHSGAIATWAITADWQAKAAVSNTTTYGTARVTALDLVDDALNGRSPTVYDVMPDKTSVVNQQETIAAREAQQKLKDKFSDWVWDDEDRAQRLARQYNDTFNNIRLRTYDGSHQTFPGMNHSILRENDLDKHQKDAVWRIIQSDNTLLAHCVGAGKAQPLDAKVLTSIGWKLMGEIQVGDTVIAGDGSHTKVEAVYPQGRKEIYRVTFSDGASTECCDEHLWLTHTYKERNSAVGERRLGKEWPCAKPKVRSLNDIRHSLRSPHLNAANHSIPIIVAPDFIADEPPIDPYLLGAILGDGCIVGQTASLTLEDDCIAEHCAALLPAGCSLNMVDRQPNCATWSITRAVQGNYRTSAGNNLVVVALRNLGLQGLRSHEKFIPHVYKFGSVQTRLAMLQGLLDTDGHVSRRGFSLRFDTSSPQLADDFTFLVNSLGGTVGRCLKAHTAFSHKGEQRVGKPSHRFSIKLPPNLKPFRYARKAETYVPKTKYLPIRYITSVEPVGVKLAQCIRVSHPSHLYVTNDFIVTHNTNVMTTACMELKRLGLAEKPIIAVPNHLVDQWGTAFLQLYPQANIFVAGKEFFAAGNRERAMARIATGNYDAVIVSHSSFEKIPVSDDLSEEFVGRQLESLEDATYEAKAQKGDSRRIVKELERAKKRLSAKLKERADRESKDDGVTFEEMGVDRIFVDESDLYKNLGYVSKMTRIAGLPNTESNRALDMYMKTQYLAERNGGVVFATGTPISNTMAEMYTMQRYLAPKALRAAGVEHFDAWAANFGEAVTSLELAPDGSGYRMHTRFAKFVNLPELLSMFRSFADVQTAQMLHLPRPALEGGKPQITAAPSSPELRAYVATLVERAKDLRQKRVDPSVDNMLKITGDGRKAALDMRLVDSYTEPSETKVCRAIDRIYATWKSSQSKRSAQLVFCDLSTPHPHKFNIYGEVRGRLTQKGIPDNEIAFIHDADTDAKKKTLFESVNAGRVRILLGSTEKMGAGTNVQKKLIALHHLDAPWRPRDIEQREGRIMRQGNDNESVEIHRYVTEGSFDAYMWQCLENKARFINQVMNGSVTVREAEDIEGGALTYAEIKAIASGNPAVMEKVKVDTEIRKLDQLRASHVNQQHSIRWEIKSLPGSIARSQQDCSAYLDDIATRNAHADCDFEMTVGNRTISGKDCRVRAGDSLNEVSLSWRNDQSMQPRGHFKGFEILTRGSSVNDGIPELFLKGRHLYKANLNPENSLGTIASIEHVLRNIDRSAESEKRELERKEKALIDYTAQLNRPFEHAERLEALLAKQAELNAKLDLDKHDVQAVPDARKDTAEAEPAAVDPMRIDSPVAAMAGEVTVTTTPVQRLTEAAGLGRRCAYLAPNA